MLELVNEIKSIKAKRREMLEKYGHACTSSKGRMVRSAYKELGEKVISLSFKGVELYGIEFLNYLED